MGSTWEEIYLQEFEHQVAGHTKEVLKSFNNRLVLKPLVKKRNFEKELQFYQFINSRKFSTQSAVQFVPKFHGIINVREKCMDDNDDTIKHMNIYSFLPYILLEDLTKEYDFPNLIDIKIGQQTFEPDAPQEKIDYEKNKYPYQEEVGFRISGMKVYNVKLGKYVVYGKDFGRSLKPNEVVFGLASYFYNGKIFRNLEISEVIKTVESMLIWMENQTKFQFISTSILIVYNSFENGMKKVKSYNNENNDFLETNDDYNFYLSLKEPVQTNLKSVQVSKRELDKLLYKQYVQPITNDLIKVKMIDFAHVIINDHDKKKIDMNYIFGLKVLLKNLYMLLFIVTGKTSMKLQNFIKKMEKIQEGFGKEL